MTVTKNKATKKKATGSKTDFQRNLEKGAEDIRQAVNKNIININKKNHWSLDLYTKQDMVNFIKKYNLEELIIKLGRIHSKMIQDAMDANYQAYLDRKDQERGTMIQKDQVTKHQERNDDELKSLKKELATTRRKLTIALKKQEKGGEA